MEFYLSEYQQIKHHFTSKEQEDLESIIHQMEKEQINIENWRLDEIPTENIYAFVNEELGQAFDIEIYDHTIQPFYLTHQIADRNATTIKEAIDHYEL